MPHGAFLFASGCFELSVQSGEVSVRGGTITKEHGPVMFASSKASMFCRLAVPVRGVTVPLVVAQAHLATACFTLTALAPGCHVSQEPQQDPAMEELDTVEDWHQVLPSILASCLQLPAPRTRCMCGSKLLLLLRQRVPSRNHSERSSLPTAHGKRCLRLCRSSMISQQSHAPGTRQRT